MFEVSREGLRQILERRGKEFALTELVQNAWDQEVTRVDITFTKPMGSRRAIIKVVDDDPNGFADITHAYTLFAPSTKKANPRQRGRFNVGEKLVIAACEVSRILTTTGAFEFVGNERKNLPRSHRTEHGSVFEGEIIMTREEFDACCAIMYRLLPPESINTYFNGVLLERRTPLAIVRNHSLATEIADAEGNLRRTTRSTDIVIYHKLPGEAGTLYEMGIPVVETGDAYDVDVQQKIPLNLDRDNVTPAYLRTIRGIVVNEIHRDLDQETAAQNWVDEALETREITPEAVQSVITQRFGDKAVVYDPSDREANGRAAAAGHTVVYGGSFSGPAWINIRSSGALVPAGQMFPTHPETAADDVKEVAPTATELRVVEAVHRIAHALLGFRITIRIVESKQMTALATYGRRTVTFNRTKLGRKFLTELSERVVDLTIHELGHEFESNHLDDRYNNALTRLGAKLAFLVVKDPSLLTLPDMAS